MTLAQRGQRGLREHTERNGRAFLRPDPGHGHLPTTPTSTDHPQANWTRRRYGDKVEPISMRNVGHNLMASGMASRAILFFGLDRR